MSDRELLQQLIARIGNLEAAIAGPADDERCLPCHCHDIPILNLTPISPEALGVTTPRDAYHASLN